MSEQYRDQIHTETLRLRLLLTNYCQQACKHCLNEYMPPYPKEDQWQNVSFKTLKDICRAYSFALGDIGDGNMPRKIYLSGGEPTLHPQFEEIALFIKRQMPGELVLCTNGNDYEKLSASGTYDLFDHLHLSFGFVVGPEVIDYFGPILASLDSWIDSHPAGNLVVSMVTTLEPGFESGLRSMIDFHRSVNGCFSLKLFGDLRHSSKHLINVRYRKLLEWYPMLLHRGPVEHPVNRGSGCQGCDRSCPTLKAAWLRPDNTIGPCPQGGINWMSVPDMDPLVKYKVMKEIYDFHFKETPLTIGVI